jgi:predicted RecB family endonuclease
MQPLDSDKAAQPKASAGCRARTALTTVLLVVLALAGCGGSSAHHSGSAAAGSGTTTSKPIIHETHADIVAAVAACRGGVNIANWLPQASKEDLYVICNKGLRRGLTEVIQYGEEVCAEVAYTSPAKSAAEKAHVYSECYAGTKLKTTVGP